MRQNKLLKTRNSFMKLDYKSEQQKNKIKIKNYTNMKIYQINTL